MKNPLARLPWFIGAPGFLGAVVVAAFVANYLGADYFKRTRLDEANPLAGAGSVEVSGVETLLHGTFRDADAGHRGSGGATVLRDGFGRLVLRLEDFSVTNGPDLFVVLSTSAAGYEADGALNLGGLKATDGNFNYDIPTGTDLSPFKSVVIWCRQFDVTFAIAEFAADGPAVQAAPTASPTPAGQPPAASPSRPPATQAPQAQPTQSPPQPTPTAQPPTATAAAPTGPVVLAQGKFRDGEPGHRGSGTAKLGRDAAGKPVLVFEDFSVTNGPDLHVILSASPNGSGQGLDLGKLKATDGTFSYTIPDGADLSAYRSVTIWCASFPTIFAVATLEA